MVELDVLLLILRGVAALLLLAFLGALFAVLWRDFHYMARAVADEKRERGRLMVIQASAESPLPDASTTEYPGLVGTVEAVPLPGMQFPLLPVTSVGRAPTNTVVLQDTFCSQEHALVTRRDGQWWLEDLQSSNGTLLNGTAISEPVVLSSGDVIGIGRVQLRVEFE